MIGRRVGRYRILAQLGEGGMATVWRAHDELIGHDVALKVLADSLAKVPDACRRFRHEAQVDSLLDHPSIAAVYDNGEEDGVIYIAMSLIEGETLAQRVARSLLPIPEVIRIISAAGGALGYAHAHGVVHRDVTARNLMLANDGRVLVVDFGLALAEGFSRVSSAGTTVGTMAYIAPEVLQGSDADPRSDLYGLGVVFYEALTGSHPHRAQIPEALEYAILNQPAAPPSRLRPEVVPALDRIVLRLLARDPQERLQNAAALLAELDTLSPQALHPTERADAPIGRSALAERLANGDGPVYLAVPEFESHPAAPDLARPPSLAGMLREALAASLASLHGVHIVSSALESGPPADPRALARQLGANAVLLATLRLSGAQARIVWRLLDTEYGVQIAGGAVRGAAADPFDLEDQLIASVRDGLALPGEARQPARWAAGDPAARERFQQALRYLVRSDHEPSLDGAIHILEGLIASEGENGVLQATLARGFLAKFRLVRQHAWEARAAAAGGRAAVLDPEGVDTLLAIGELREAAGRHAEALADFERARSLRPQCFEAQIGIARVLDAGGRIGEALEACREAIAWRPDDWRGYNQLGLLFFKQGEVTRAIEPWRRALQLNPDNARAASNLGSALFHMDRHEDAIVALQRSIDIQPNAYAYTNLGTVLFYLHRFEESSQWFERAVGLTPSDPNAWGNLGNAVRFVPGREARAREALERAIGLMRERLERNPADADSWARLAGWYANLDDKQSARDAIRRALELSPHDVHAMVHAGNVYCILGEHEEALHWLETAVAHGHGRDAILRAPDLAPLKEDPRFQRILETRPASSGATLAVPTGRKGESCA